VALMLALIVVFYQVCTYDFVNFDDPSMSIKTQTSKPVSHLKPSNGPSLLVTPAFGIP